MGFPGEGNEIYQPNDSEWHRKNLGKEYKVNPNNPFTLVNDLSIWLLQHYGVEITWNEMLGIKLTDGLYDEANKPYYMSRTADSKLKTNLGYVMHQADCMAARIEYERWANTKSNTKPSTRINQSYGKKARAQKLGNIAANSQTTATLKMFDDLGFEKGDNQEPMPTPLGAARILICYEIIFPNQIRKKNEKIDLIYKFKRLEDQGVSTTMNYNIQDRILASHESFLLLHFPEY